MQDRPTYDELLAAVEGFLERDVMVNSEGARRFQARVSLNVLRIIRRELEREEEHLAAEWAGLDALLGAGKRPEGRPALREALAARSEQLCERIRKGDADEGAFREAVLTHVRRSVRDKLQVSDPDWLRRDGEGDA